MLILISRIILVYYYKCCNLIGYFTHYLFLDRYSEQQNNHFLARFLMFLCDILCLISDSTKRIRLVALDFYEVIADSGFALITS